MGKEAYLKLLDAFAQQHPSPGASVAGTRGAEEFVVHGRTVSLSFKADERFPEDGMVICRTDVARFKGDGPPHDLVRLLLQANNLWAGTAGSTFGLRGKDTLMMTCARRIGSLNVAALDGLLNLLCADAGNWAGKFAAAPKSEPPPPDFHLMLQMRA